jgi:hypothetical protein
MNILGTGTSALSADQIGVIFVATALFGVFLWFTRLRHSNLHNLTSHKIRIRGHHMKLLRTSIASFAFGVGVISLLVTALPAQAVALPTGNSKTIAFYRAMARKTQVYGTNLVRQTGFASLQVDGKYAVWSNAEAPPAGFSPAREDIIIASTNGKVTWVTDLITARCSGGKCASVETLLDSSGVFSRQPSGPYSTSCWTKSQGPIAGITKTGGPSGYGVNGYFAPMKQVGGNGLVTSTYPYGNGRTATELDTISLATDLPIKGVIRVSSGRGLRAFYYSFSDSWLKSTEVQPRVTFCNS